MDRAYGDEYWADVTSPLFFSLVGEYLTEYVNHEGARIMRYREIADNCVRTKRITHHVKR